MKETIRISSGILLIRTIFSALLLFHGFANFTSDYNFIKSALASISLPGSLAYLVFISEIIAPIAVLSGIKARFAAMIIVINLILAILISHSQELTELNAFGGWAVELQVLYLTGFLSIAILGPGKFKLNLKF
ncbi:GntR family transcriptional regulator [Tenacibaculum litopenaei]|uniref:DoxX family protein n=1 Tax=Tenacibaculum litopenaei TaxID=396016 RepID=UPI003892E2AA